MPDFTQITAAAERAHGHIRRTPLLNSPALDRIAGRRVFVKAECLQHTGSFKLRGAWAAVSSLSEAEKSSGVVAVSSGNHAQGIALAARAHQVRAVIIMPSDAPTQKIENTRTLGAEVVLYNRTRDDRDALSRQLCAERGLTMISPYDHAQVIAGQGTVGIEIAEQAREQGIKTAQVLVPCGGGGLTSGVALALQSLAPDMTVHPCEPVGFDDAIRSLNSGKIERNQHSSGSICDAILTPSPGKITFPIMRRLCQPGVALTDNECLRAMALAFAWLKIVIEPGGAVALAAALFHGQNFDNGDLIAVASGGNVDAAVFQHALALND